MSRRALRRAGAVVAVALLGAVAVRAFVGRVDAHVHATLPVAAALAADTAGFARASAPRRFSFPEDHGPHAAFATEWWYFTGNVQAADGRSFGYQLTFFRKALAPDAPPRASAWAANQAYMAHFAITDVEGESFHAFDRFARGALDLAGAEASPLRVWLHDWRAAAAAAGAASPDAGGEEPAHGEILPTTAPFPLRVTAADGDVAIDLVVERGKPPVRQGDRGLSAKGPEPGNASYYYSLPRMPTHGTVRIGDAAFDVAGTSWMDREWSTSGLSADVVGWDWFGLQLSDTTELMLYRLRRADGRASAFSGGSVVDARGAARTLAADDVVVVVLDSWTSPRTAVPYPARWRVRIPSDGLDVTITPVLADQELRLAVRYWEGAVRVDGTRRGRAVDGVGYVELTGYGEDAASAAVRGR